MQRHVSRVLFPEKSKVSFIRFHLLSFVSHRYFQIDQTINIDDLITKTLNYGIPVSYADKLLELRLHFPEPIGQTGSGQETYYVVLFLAVHKRRWNVWNIYVDPCPYVGKINAKHCQWRRHFARSKRLLKPDVDPCYDITDEVVLGRIKEGCLDQKGNYDHECEGKKYISFCLAVITPLFSGKLNQILHRTLGSITGKTVKISKWSQQKQQQKKSRKRRRHNNY